MYIYIYIYIYILFQTDSFQILLYKGLASKSLTGAKESHHEGLSAEERETLQTKAAEDGAPAEGWIFWGPPEKNEETWATMRKSRSNNG